MKDTLYFMLKIDIGNVSPQRAREHVAVINRMIESKQTPDDQYNEKWYILPVTGESTQIELVYPVTDETKRILEVRSAEFLSNGFQFENDVLPLAEVQRRYAAKVEQISDDFDWKTSFEPDEICSYLYDIINRTNEPGKDWFPILYCGVSTINNRKYEYNAVCDVMQDFRNRIAEGMFGQLGYPIDADTNEMDITINNLEKQSHRVKDAKLIDGILWANIEILDNINGNVLREMLDNNEIVFRTAAVGSVDANNSVLLESFIGVHAIPVHEDAFSVK